MHKKALESAFGYYNWGDVSKTVPDEIFAKHGLTRIYQESVDVFVSRNEILCNYEADKLADKQKRIRIHVRGLLRKHIIKNNESIKYWQNGENFLAEETADKIAKQNEKLTTLFIMDLIDENLINELIQKETEDELILIYEEILELLEEINE